MNRFTKKILTIALLICFANVSFADRGIGKKNKTRTILNISTATSLKSSIAFNLKSGLSYKGSLLTSHQTIGSSIMNNSIVTYQKGNITYIIPYQYKVVMPEIKQGYTGIKLIIRPR